MEERSLGYLKAAEAYLSTAKHDLIWEHYIEVLIRSDALSLEKFLISHEGLMAQAMLAAADTFISLGIVPDPDNNVSTYYMDNDGLWRFEGKTELTPDYYKEHRFDIDFSVPIDATDAVGAAVADKVVKPGEFMHYMYQRLESIRIAAPTQLPQ